METSINFYANKAEDEFIEFNSLGMTVSKERWFRLSLAEQLGNIDSEVGRARAWQGKDEKSFWGAVMRTLEFLDLTRENSQREKRQYELNRARETFADAVLGGKEYKSTLIDLEKYFMQFALLATRTGNSVQ